MIMKRKIDNYRDLFDDDFLDIVVRDVLQEYVETLLEVGCEKGDIDDVMKVVKHYSTVEEYEEFVKEIGYE